MKLLALLAGAIALAIFGGTAALAAGPSPSGTILVAQGDEADDTGGEGDDAGAADAQGGDEAGTAEAGDDSADNPDEVPDSADMDAAEAEVRRQLNDARIQVQRRGARLIVIMNASILFSFDSYEVSREGTAAAQTIARVLVRHRRSTVEVNGHTDTRGTPAYNDVLSDNRARAVAQILVASGVAPERIRANGYGESQLAVQTPDETKEIRNRRVEIVIHPARRMQRDRHNRRHPRVHPRPRGE